MAARSKPAQSSALLKRHASALGYVLGVLLPLILRKRRRPVIFSRWSGMGDIICTFPAALELKKRHPGATFLYNCHPDFAAIPKLAGVADHITSLEPIGLIGYWYRFLLAGFYHFAHGDDTPGKVAQEPMVMEFCRQFNLPVTDSHPELPVSATAREKVRALLAQKNLDPAALVLVHSGPSWPVKEWPREKWTQLVAELRAHGCTQIAQLGVGRGINSGPAAAEPLSGAVSLLDALSIEECIAAISLARLFVGIDSGLLHIAACTHTPAVGIFGSTLPQFFYAEGFRRGFIVSSVTCAGCFHRSPRLHWITGCPYDIQCMRTIGVDAVLRQCLARLGKSASV